ncbi:MAG: phosphogluconate dehydrogenase (NAD(+)-dependent, decarboxylating) [Candidatus Xenobia bacterium]
MQLGMIGMGRMGANMAKRLRRAGHDLVLFNRDQSKLKELVDMGCKGVSSYEELVKSMQKPRAIWMMVPVAAVDGIIDTLVPLMEKGDILIDGGNSYYHDDIRRAKALKDKGIHYVDVGVSGGVWGEKRGYGHMIGGEDAIVNHLDPIFNALAPGVDSASRTPEREEKGAPKGTAEKGYLHCGGHGAGHFVKMVHNGIEYGIMQAYAEGLNILKNANVGRKSFTADAETTPLRNPELYQFDFNLAEITEMWRRGTVIGSWLLDLTASALFSSPTLDKFGGRVSDSGEGRWTCLAAIDEGVPTPVLSAALFERFESRGNAEFADKVLSAMRFQFGGHLEKKEEAKV